MVRKKQLNVDSCDKKYSYLKNAYKPTKKAKCLKCAVISLIVLLIIGIGISIFFECRCQSSCYEYFNGPTLPPFVLSSATFEVIQVIGFSSLLIGFIYVHYDKEILGVLYSDVFKRIFPLYGLFSAIHILGVLSCFAFATAEFSESAFMALMIVLLCSIYQFYVIRCIILDKNKLIEFAYMIWDERSQNKFSDVDKYTRCLVEKIPSRCDLYYDEFLDSLAVLFSTYPSVVDTSKELGLKEISNIWDIYISNPNVIENKSSTEELFVKLIECLSDKNRFQCPEVCLCKLACGYIISMVKMISENNKDEYLDLKPFIHSMHVCRHNLFIRALDNEQRRLIHTMFECMYTNIYLLIWMYFQYNKIKLSSDLLKMIPKDIKYIIYIDEISEVLIKPACDNTRHYQNHLVLAKTQLIKRQ